MAHLRTGTDLLSAFCQVLPKASQWTTRPGANTITPPATIDPTQFSEAITRMADERVRRRLAAIAVADVVGYSRLMEGDETGTLAVLMEFGAVNVSLSRN